MENQQNTDVNRKINYLLSQIRSTETNDTNDEFIEWLRLNRDKIESLFTVVEVLRNEGISTDDLVTQIEFGNEFRALLAFQQEYTRIHNTDALSTQAGTFIFERNMIQQFEQSLIRIEPSPNLIPSEVNNGLMLIPLSTVRIRNTGSSEYFLQKGENTSLQVLQSEIGPLFTISIGNLVYRLQGDDAAILGMNQLTSLIQQRLLMLSYTRNGDDYEIRSIEAEIDISTTTVNIINSANSVSIPKSDFKAFVRDLPRSIRLVQNIIATERNNDFLMYKQIYVATLLQELLPQISAFYEANFGSGLADGLFGQGAAVSISQLYNLAKATLRREEVSYKMEGQNIQARQALYVNPIPGYSPFTHQVPFDQNQVFGIARSAPAFHTAAWRWENFPLTMTGVTVTGSQAMLTDTLAMTRTTATKIPISRTTSTTSGTSEMFIEERISNMTGITLVTQTIEVRSLPSNTLIDSTRYKLNGIAGGNINQNGAGVAEFYGLNLLVRTPTNGETRFRYAVTRRYTSQATRTLYAVLKPENLASDSTSILTARVEWKENTTQRNATIQMTPQRIDYANGTANAYVGVLRTTTGTYVYDVVSDVEFVGKVELQDGLQYSGNNVREVITSPALSAFKPRLPTQYIAMLEQRPANLWTAFTRLPGQVLDNDPTQRSPGVALLSPPFCWQSWLGGFSDDYISCYLSTSDYLPSAVPSRLRMDIDRVGFSEIMGQTETTVSTSLFGYDVAGNRNFTPSVPLLKATNISGTFSSIRGFNTTLIGPQVSYTITDFEGEVIELVLPSGIYNQFTLSESILNLQSGIAFLTAYADYLKYLIDNLSDRITIVEQTMDDVIRAIDAIIDAISPQQSSIGAQILGFIGPAVGMFFPLTGLALSITGNIFSGVTQIENGNLLVGVMDITTGALMSVLGIRKFKQRMDRRYGTTPVVVPPVDPNRLPSYEELFGRPGFNAVGTSQIPSTTTTVRTSSGVIKNSNITYENKKVIVESLLFQQGLYSSYSTRFDRQAITSTAIAEQSGQLQQGKVIAGKTIETWDDLGTRLSFTAGLYELDFDMDANSTERLIDQTEFSTLFRTDMPVIDYVHWLYVYGHLGEQVSESLGMDDETMKLMAISNLSPATRYVPDVNTNTHSRIFYKDKTRVVDYASGSSVDERMYTTEMARFTIQQNISPMSVSQIADIMNPSKMTDELTVRVFNNMFDYSERRF